MPIKHMESLQPALAELERAVNWAAREVDDIPFHLVPVIQTRGRKTKCAGWFSENQWSTREGEMVHEITFCAEELNADPVDIVGIAIHEVVHLWVNFLKLKDVSTGGRHNKVFKEYAEIVGLEVAKPFDSYGYGYTTVSDDLRKRIEKEFKPDVAAFNLFRLVKPSTTKPVKTNAWICDCDGLTLRIPAKQKLDATCHKCNKKFVPKDAPKVDSPPKPIKVKRHKHVDGLPEHEDNVPFHEHKEGEGHDILEPVELIDKEPIEPEAPELADPDVDERAQEETVELRFDHEHSKMFPLHIHGEEAQQHGNSDPMSDTDLVHDEDAGIEPSDSEFGVGPDAEAEMVRFGHTHSEFFPYHYHQEGEVSQDTGDPEWKHGYVGEDYDGSLEHDEDAGILWKAAVVEADKPKTTKKPAKKAKKAKK